MSTVNNGRTNVSELRDRVVKLGGTPKGRTIAELLDEIEHLTGSGEGGSITPQDVERIISEKLPPLITEALDDMESDSLDDGDFDDIFGA